MGTILKYVIYFVVFAAALFILKGLWDGELTTNSTIKEMGEQVDDGVTSTIEEAKRVLQK